MSTESIFERIAESHAISAFVSVLHIGPLGQWGKKCAYLEQSTFLFALFHALTSYIKKHVNIQIIIVFIWTFFGITVLRYTRFGINGKSRIKIEKENLSCVKIINYKNSLSLFLNTKNDRKKFRRIINTMKNLVCRYFFRCLIRIVGR